MTTMMTPSITRTPDPAQRLYKPRGAALEAWKSRDPQVVLSGPAGTGKSRAVLEKLYHCALKYPGMRALMVRKTRESMTESTLVTWEEKVLPANSPVAANTQRRMRQSYHFPNGSEIVVGGIDKPGKIMSTEYDMIYVQEAIELTEDDLESLTTRLRNGVMPYQQLIGDTNPDVPHHWLYQRSLSGLTRLLESRHEDNPRLWDAAKGEWTAEGRAYIATLDALTGTRKARLRHGLWVAAEGIVYEEYDPAIHLIDRFEIPRDWLRYWVIDFGYRHPFVWQAWAQDPDGDLYRYREIYMTGRIVRDHAKAIEEATEHDPRPIAVITDHDAEDRATIEDALGVSTDAAYKSVSPGIQAVKVRLRPDERGRPRMYYLRDSLVERDPALVKAKKPTCTEEEYGSYVWNTAQGRTKGEEPMKIGDDGMDCTRYMVCYADDVKDDDGKFHGSAQPRIAGAEAGWSRGLGDKYRGR